MAEPRRRLAHSFSICVPSCQPGLVIKHLALDVKHWTLALIFLMCLHRSIVMMLIWLTAFCRLVYYYITDFSDCFASCSVMASSAPYKQDLPPKGGYAPINFRRIPARQVQKCLIIEEDNHSSFPGPQCSDHLRWPDRVHGSGSLVLQEGNAHMENLGKVTWNIKRSWPISGVVLNYPFFLANGVQVRNSGPHPPHAGWEG